LAARLDPVLGGRRLANYIAVRTLEAQTIACACGKSHLHKLEPEDLVALTIESARWRACRWRAPIGCRAAAAARRLAFPPRDEARRRHGGRLLPP
jgi:hypothetical protein